MDCDELWRKGSAVIFRQNPNGINSGYNHPLVQSSAEKHCSAGALAMEAFFSGPLSYCRSWN